ncbi:MAG: hypothetical protein QXE01_02005 [Sulfolobales archaeon]
MQKQELLSLEEGEFLDTLRKIYRYVKALQVLKKRPLYTREFLSVLRSWGDSHALLKELEALGLVIRYTDYCRSSKRKCVYNKISAKGDKLLNIIGELSRLIFDTE